MPPPPPAPPLPSGYIFFHHPRIATIRPVSAAVQLSTITRILLSTTDFQQRHNAVPRRVPLTLGRSISLLGRFLPERLYSTFPLDTVTRRPQGHLPHYPLPAMSSGPSGDMVTGPAWWPPLTHVCCVHSNVPIRAAYVLLSYPARHYFTQHMLSTLRPSPPYH
ncbi:hypothetical protein E2C01_075520 [Portunus trituberculatus]|uniref:Uncharacterized protein n=1 Tax=Portunus trituberculatus TaxID=210409 RepID=A0A5B7IAW7_PORTR|nr:hypothetical protein [Portunus trituberculatus]